MRLGILVCTRIMRRLPSTIAFVESSVAKTSVVGFPIGLSSELLTIARSRMPSPVTAVVISKSMTRPGVTGPELATLGPATGGAVAAVSVDSCQPGSSS